jgi:hypothetical protein
MKWRVAAPDTAFLQSAVVAGWESAVSLKENRESLFAWVILASFQYYVR